MARPRILVIDDVYGRQATDGYNAERIRLCEAMLLRDETGDQPPSTSIKVPIADAVFCRGQKPARTTVGDVVENDMESVVNAVRSGWSLRTQGTAPWALVLLDLSFTTGPVTGASNAKSAGSAAGRPGDGDETSCFGFKVLSELNPLGHGEFHDLPIVVLSRLSRDGVKTQYSRLGAAGFIEGNEPEPMAAILRGYLWRHGLISDGAERSVAPVPPRRWTAEQEEALLPVAGNAIVGHSVRVLTALREARRAAVRQSSILLSGDTGTGKELLARYVWRVTRQPSRPFVPVDSGGLVETLAEDTLFGHFPGAAEGIRDFRKGKIREADGGDLFLDEIAYLPSGVQLKLMRAVALGEIQPLGTDRVFEVTVRFISATDRPIEQWVRDGRFNNALFARLAATRIPTLPRLADRPEDIPLLVRHFFDRALVQLRNGHPSARLEEIDPQVVRDLSECEWPENVRGLRDAVDSAVQRAQDVELLTVRHFGGLSPRENPAAIARTAVANAVVDPLPSSEPRVIVRSSIDLARILSVPLIDRARHQLSNRIVCYAESKKTIEATISQLCQQGALVFPERVELDSLLTDTWHQLDGLLSASGHDWRSGNNPVRHTMKAKVRALNAAVIRILVRLGHQQAVVLRP